MLSALKSELLRLLTLRSTLVYAVLLTGTLYGPPVLIVALDSGSESPTYTAADLGQFSVIFMIVAIVFAGASTAGEIRRGSLGVTFLTQRSRWVSYLARAVVVCLFVALNFIVGMALALGVFKVGSAQVDLSGGGVAYLALNLLSLLSFVLITMGLAAVTRSTSAAIALPLAWLLFIESLFASVPIKAFQEVAQWLPLVNWSYLFGTVYPPAASEFITHGSGPAIAAVSVSTAIFLGGGWYSHVARDIPA